MSDEKLKATVKSLRDKHKEAGCTKDIIHILTEHDLKHMGLVGHELDRAITFLYQFDNEEDNNGG